MPKAWSLEFSSKSNTTSLIEGTVDDSARITLAGNVHPLAQARYDMGEVEDSFPIERVYLILHRSREQESALQGFLAEAHSPESESYHHWLTPQEFGTRFGVSDSDLAGVRSWLESHGLKTGKLHAGRIAIEFSGTAAQIREAFQTEIHRYEVGGETHYANDRDPKIPAAFRSVVAGISPMHSFHAKPAIRMAGTSMYDPLTHVAKPKEYSLRGGVHPDWTVAGGTDGVTFELAPSDFAVQYDLASVYAAGTTGKGESIGILSDSNIDLSLVQGYQTLFGLPANLPTVVIDGNDPSQNDLSSEAYLDVEIAGSVAPGAKIYLYTSAGTVLTDPLLNSGLRAIDDNVVSTLSASYTSCESALGASGNLLYSKLWQEAAAQGISVFVAAGDGGSAGCDNFNSSQFAQEGLAVNGIGSTPYNVAVGGTDFYYSDYASGGSVLNNQIAQYWSFTTQQSPKTSLLKPAPEQVWNDAFGYNAEDKGIYNTNDSTIVGGGGGASNAAVYSSGVASGYPKPAWQTGKGVSADKVRDVPDVSLFAADGLNFVYYPICAIPGDCLGNGSTGPVQIQSAGGTSAASPAMAAIQALVDQATKSRQGQADYVYYALASKAPTAFHDIDLGVIEVPCVKGSLNCVLGSSGPNKGFYTLSGYSTTPGYDEASGLGSIDVANLIKDWSLVTFSPSKTTLSISPATFAHGTTVTVKATVAPASGSGVPTGSVGLTSNDPQAYAGGLDLLSLSGGSVTSSLDNLPGGTYTVVADYTGDATYRASSSTPVSVTVTPEKDTLKLNGWYINPQTGATTALTAGETVPFGSIFYVDAQLIGVNEANSTLGDNVSATGAVTFTDTVGTTSTSSTFALNGHGVAQYFALALPVGANTISATYAGDNSFEASTASPPLKLAVAKGATSLQLKPLETTVVPGSSLTVDVAMTAGALPLVGRQLPTGNVSVKLGGQTLAVPFNSWGRTGFQTDEAIVTFTNVPAGTLALSASYQGDSNWGASSATYGTVTVKSGLTAPKVIVKSNSTAYTPTQSVTVVATVTGVSGKARPSGNLYLTWQDAKTTYSGTLSAGPTSTSSTYTLTFPANQLLNGSNLIEATFVGDSNYSAQSSLPLTLSLNGGDFSIGFPAQALPVVVGNSVSSTMTVRPIDAYSSSVTVACSAPTGITCKPATTSPVVGTGVTDAISFQAAANVAAGSYPAVVTVTGGGRTHTIQILIEVESAQGGGTKK